MVFVEFSTASGIFMFVLLISMFSMFDEVSVKTLSRWAQGKVKYGLF